MDDQKKELEKVQELQRLSTIGQISAGIAHEIRNPLTAVKGFLQLMQKEHDSRYWEIVNSELEQAISTVQNLLVVSKPELNDESWSNVNMCQLLESTLSLFENEMYRVKVEKRLYNTNSIISGKRNQLKRAIFNLLKNAFEAIEGEGSITLEHYKSGDEICIHIRDSGKGIPSDKLKHLGTPFFSTKSDVGTGLGLSQVYAAFYEHKATISVKSKENKGTEFIIRMPLSQRSIEGSKPMNLHIEPNMEVRDFFDANRQHFNRMLEVEAQNCFEIVSSLKFVTTQDLLDHANQILSLVHDGMTQEIIRLAQERGLVWAKSDVPIMTKMEWFYALRRVIWLFLKEYHLSTGITPEEAFELSDRINDALDNFIIQFNVIFTKYRDDVIKSKQAIIDELTVPLIPIFNQIAVLPLVGTLDESRMIKIEEKLLEEVERRNIQKVFIDMSGAVLLEADIFNQVTRLIEGLNLLGCATVLTGISAKLAKVILDLSPTIKEKIIVQSTLQQALIKETHMMKE
ncbi:ATP-binding protein [Paenibacillus hexagrammi]|uniref:histidine kinase n=1 Tax=Paenibacillus hexagrammi TaxID=2908839 RepID=A0ABY3SK81_9BACL|nr:ATP-binding protein [Paenibacillus sp. YPD9-1]UJF33387.1 ATP-binding protein [Paenibacillus sp. YPD9-1]